MSGSKWKAEVGMGNGECGMGNAEFGRWNESIADFGLKGQRVIMIVD